MLRRHLAAGRLDFLPAARLDKVRLEPVAAGGRSHEKPWQATIKSRHQALSASLIRRQRP